MQFENLARNYIRKFQEKCVDAWSVGANAIELATRPVVHEFIENLSKSIQPNITVLHDTQLRSSFNKPDWRMEDLATFGVYCYGDHKDLSKNNEFQLNRREQDQVARYLDLGRPLFIFDGAEFLFFTDDIRNPERVPLIPKPLDPDIDWSSFVIEPLIEVRFCELLKNPGCRKWTESDIVQQLAHRARLLSETVQQLLNSPIDSGVDVPENTLIQSLHNLWDLVQKHHDPALADSRACGDFIAQVLAFGLFFAHTRAPKFGSTPQERHKHISDFWLTSSFVDEAKRLRPFQTITDLLGESLSAKNDLAVWYRDSATVLAHAEYMGAQDGPCDYHIMFERFLEAFDKDTRFDRGVFYTPTSLAGWMARETDVLVKSHFGGSICQVAHKVIDPCCGTGGILEAIIKETPIPNDSLPIFAGFEVLPAPYALAHYRLDKLISGTPLVGKVRILLTDTLSDYLSDPPTEESSGFTDELAEAVSLAIPPLHVIIGNPPSSKHVASKAPRSKIKKMLELFRPPKLKRTDRQNVQQALNNEAIRFLLWCAHKIINSGRGVLTLVLPGSFAYSISFKYARRWIAEHFQDIYVLALDQDIRTGVRGSSLFDVRQGRLVLFAVLRETPAPPAGDWQPKINYFDISARSLEEKHEFLNNKTDVLEDFSSLNVSESSWSFTPVGSFPETTWNSFWPLRDAQGKVGIFKSKCSAVKLAPTSVLFHTGKGILTRRSQSIADRQKSDWALSFIDLKRSWWEGQQKPPRQNKFTDGVCRSLGVAASNSGETIIPYSYRPFVEGYVICDNNLFEALAKAPGDGTRARPEILAAFGQGALGIALSPSTIDLGDTLTRFVSFAWHLPDNDIAARGNAMIYCDLFPEEKKRGREWDDTVHTNISTSIERLFSGPDSRKDVLFYVYAVMNCHSYLESFEAVLYGPSNPDAPPRVPIADDAEIRRSIVGYGKMIAKCEKEDVSVELLESLESDWPDVLDEIRLESYKLNDEDQTISLNGTKGETFLVTGIPEHILTLHVSGYGVVSKWLRERRFSYLRRTFRKPDMEDLFKLISRIAKQATLLVEVDLIVEKVLSSGTLTPPPDQVA